MKTTQERLQKWQIARANQNSANQYNPLHKLAEEVDTGIQRPKQSKNQIVEQNTSAMQSLDELLPEFDSLDEAIKHVEQQDADIEAQAANMIDKVRIIKNQVRGHKELLDQTEEVMQDVEKNMSDAKDGVIENRVTADDIKKRLMKGDKCMMICIMICLVLIAIYWVYRLVAK